MTIDNDQLAREGVGYESYRELLESDEYEFQRVYHNKDIRYLLTFSMNELSREIAIARQECQSLHEDYFRLRKALNKLEWDDEDLLSKFKMPPTWNERFDKFKSEFEIEYNGSPDKKFREVMFLIELREEYRVLCTVFQ